MVKKKYMYFLRFSSVQLAVYKNAQRSRIEILKIQLTVFYKALNED